MRIKLVVPGIALCAVVAMLGGCGKPETSPTTEVSNTNAGITAPGAAAIDATKTAAQQTANPAAEQVKAGEQKAQGIIDSAKTQVSDKKYQEALSTLSQLASTKLTAEQQKLVDNLKAQIQSALAKGTASDAASTLGGALGGKK